MKKVVLFFLTCFSWNLFAQLSFNETFSLKEKTPESAPFIIPLSTETKNLIRTFSNKGELSFLKPFNKYYYLNDDLTNRDSSFIMDARLNTNYYIFDLDEEKDASWRKNFMFDLYAFVDVRIIDQESGPVRTPSYRPGFRIYYIPLKSPFNSGDKEPDKKFSGIFNKYFKNSFYLSGTHYSNGQDGNPLSRDAILNPDYRYINDLHHFNVYNGNFSTNYWDVGWDWFACYSKYSEGEEQREHLFNLNVNFENHFIVKPLLGVEPELFGYLSRANLDFRFNYISVKKSSKDNWYTRKEDSERFRLSLNSRIRLGDISRLDEISARRFDLEATFNWRIPFSSFTSIFFKTGYLGSDYYNIYLEDRALYFKFGISAGEFVF